MVLPEIRPAPALCHVHHCLRERHRRWQRVPWNESILLIKPYLQLLTMSELHVVMSSGFATVSGTILAAYIGFGAEPAHLVTASVMSAPAAICYSKLLMPETKRSLTTVDNIQPVVSEDLSALSAATRGATNGTSLILNIIANIIAFVAFIAFMNGVLSYAGGMLGHPELNLEWILGKVFIPLCWAMGVPWEECELVGSLIGLKTVVNEFVAYQRMGEMKKAGLLSPRSELIATYSLCGFTNPGSAGIMIGAIAAIAPNQREILSSVRLLDFVYLYLFYKGERFYCLTNYKNSFTIICGRHRLYFIPKNSK
ncbi:unnamed protein product [Diatraea saccharalis]|uniref:Concentrative nucleoside transporter C-terminal domain-containing protein n=1 Tax=Diatraea saccharalis TaxID=40085 RepID=A0A9P0CAR0_9NEOP|nr:unnamed protein product [Diatraea saccharalis]